MKKWIFKTDRPGLFIPSFLKETFSVPRNLFVMRHGAELKARISRVERWILIFLSSGDKQSLLRQNCSHLNFPVYTDHDNKGSRAGRRQAMFFQFLFRSHRTRQYDKLKWIWIRKIHLINCDVVILKLPGPGEDVEDEESLYPADHKIWQLTKSSFWWNCVCFFTWVKNLITVYIHGDSFEAVKRRSEWTLLNL